MLGYILMALGLMAYVGIIFVICTLFFDAESMKEFLLGCLLTIGLLTFTFWFADSISKDSPPCAQYETQMMYNAATKTIMPARFCAVEGEWVK